MPQYNFGLGSVTLVPSVANPTPVQVAVISDISVDFSYNIKELMGQYQFAVDAVRGAGKIGGKAKNSSVNGALLLACLGGNVTQTTGTVTGVSGEAGVIPTTPFQVTSANSGTFLNDHGVLDLTANIFLTRVASSPATGQYSEASGIYTFASADVGHNVGLSYSYSGSGTGLTTYLPNTVLNAQTVTAYAMDVFNTGRDGKSFGFHFPNVIIPKLGYIFKAEAYTEQDVDFTAYQSQTSPEVCSIYTKE